MAVLKRAIKRAVKAGALRLGPLFRRTGGRILTYHSIGARDHEMNVSPDAFRAQMEWLAAHFDVVPLDEALHRPDAVAITFDDGFADNLVHGASVLGDLGLPATCFIVAGRLGGVLDGEADPDNGRLMTAQELNELDAHGLSVGAHTMSHPHLSALNPNRQRDEILGSKRLLEEILGHEVRAFAYPFGAFSDYSDETVSLVREAGFSLAVTNRYGTNAPAADRWTLRRIWIDRTDDLSLFKAKVDGRLDALMLLESTAGLLARDILNRLSP
jgi:peptidoglycan/xylan/chitin deacetylase (PgdA/CDA1 family)